jgi:hypothetical protein
MLMHCFCVLSLHFPFCTGAKHIHFELALDQCPFDESFAYSYQFGAEALSDLQWDNCEIFFVVAAVMVERQLGFRVLMKSYDVSHTAPSLSILFEFWLMAVCLVPTHFCRCHLAS